MLERVNKQIEKLKEENTSMALFFAYLAIVAALLSGLLALIAESRDGAHRLLTFLFNVKSFRLGQRLPKLQGAITNALEAARFPTSIRHSVFALLGLSGISAVVGGLIVLISQDNLTGQIAFGLPWLAWHVRFDALAGFFFLVVGIGVTAVSLFGPGYVREFEHGKHPFSVLGFFTGLFVAGMLLVLIADDAFFFVIAWELMSVSSYFLVAYQHEHSANRRAAFIYLLMAEIGALSIILAFGVLAGFGGAYTFDAMREAALNPLWMNIAFVLALIGFGMKAGLVPIHVWLPEAHPVAPSHISALMSGVMLKVAVYGFIRFGFDLLGDVQWEWGFITLFFGTASAVLGVLYAIMQHNLKRLLAYHSIENIGIIFMGLGLAMLFFSDGKIQLGILGFAAALYHTLNHALFKSLLFLGAGSILHQTHEDNIEHMGGLIHRMPKTAALFLIGCLSISALPPFNGFVSEWLTFQAALQAPALESGVLRSLIPVSAAVLALSGALAATCFVKVYGVMFLGLPRTRHVGHANEVKDRGMLAGPAVLAALCFLLGILPTPVVQGLNNVTGQLFGAALPSAASQGWLWLTPVSPKVASYSAPLVLIGLLLAWWIGYRLLHRPGGAAVRGAEPWDCGFGGLNARMEYTSSAFSMPLRRIFAATWEVQEEVTKETQDRDNLRISGIRYHLHIGDHSWRYLYDPISRWVMRLARRIGLIQTGNIRTYIAYSFFTLLILLWAIT